MDNTELAYLAGFFDGEGCIRIICVKDRGYLYGNHRLWIQLTNTNQEIMDKIRNLGWYVREIKKLKKHWKRCWVGVLKDNKALEFLQSVFPFLTVKRDEAKLAIEFQLRKLEMKNKKGRNGNGFMEFEYRESIKKQLSELKEQKI